MIHDETIENIQWGKNFLLNPIFKTYFVGLKAIFLAQEEKTKKEKKMRKK